MAYHDLPTEGAWVELRDPTELRNRHRKQITERLVGAVEIDADGRHMPVKTALAYVAGMDINDLVAAMLVTKWHIPYLDDPDTPPADRPDVIGDLTFEDADRLAELIRPGVALLMPKKPSPDDHADPTSPTPPVSDSARS